MQQVALTFGGNLAVRSDFKSTFTDQEGNFLITGVLEGSYELAVINPGYVFRMPRRTVYVTPNAVSGGHDFGTATIIGGTWIQQYGGNGYSGGGGFIKTRDGGYLLGGLTDIQMFEYVERVGTELPFLITGSIIVKLDGQGYLSWQRSYNAGFVQPGDSPIPTVAQESDRNVDYINRRVLETPDGGYVFAKSVISHFVYVDYVGGTPDPVGVYVVKTDGVGNIAWGNVYGGYSRQWVSDLAVLGDGGFILTGYVAGIGAGDSDLMVVRLDSNGRIQWQKAYGGAGLDVGDRILQTVDGGCIVAGFSKSFTHGTEGDEDVWVLKLDGGGNVQWQSNYGGLSLDSLQGLAQTADGGYVFVGNSLSYPDPIYGWDGWVVKLDAQGRVECANAYDGAGLYAILPGADNGYVVGGKANGALIMKLNAQGDIQWMNNYPGNAVYSLLESGDGGYLASATSAGPERGEIIMKLDAAGGAEGAAGVIGAAGVVARRVAVSSTETHASVTGLDLAITGVPGAPGKSYVTSTLLTTSPSPDTLSFQAPAAEGF